MIIRHSNGDINQSVHQHIATCDPIMASSRNYVGSVYYDSQQLVTKSVSIFKLFFSDL